MLRTIWRVFVVANCVAVFCLPILVKAESVTPATLRAVTTFAASKDYCKVKQDTRTADCSKQMTLCDANKWSSYVSSNVTFVGSTPQRNSGVDVPDEVLSFLRMDAAYRSSIPPLNEAACYCECPEGSTSAACEGKPTGTPFRVGSDLQTREECVSLCSQAKSEIASKCAGSLPSLVQADTSTTEGKQAIDIALQSANAQIVCFTQEECLDKKGTWESYSICPSGKGRCYAPPPTLTLNTQIGSVKEIQGFGNYIIVIFRYLLSIVVFITTIMFTWGAFRYFIGSTGSGTSAALRASACTSVTGKSLTTKCTRSAY